MICPNCGQQTPPDSEFCPSCGAALSDTTCAQCRAELPAGSNFCRRCGAPARPTQAAAPTPDGKYLSAWRVGLLGLLSLGLYLFYWAFATWKQMSAETRDREQHPVWHALALLVPIYNLFVLHDHFATIKRLQENAGLSSGIRPGWAVVIAVAFGVTVAVDTAVYGENFSFLTPLGPLILVGMTLWGQVNLNRYWTKSGPSYARAARLGVGEVLITLVGALILALAALGTLLGPVSSVSSVFHAGPVTPIGIDVQVTGSIEGNMEVDAFSFDAIAGREYVMEVGPGAGDPLEDPLLTLWDSDGTTVLEQNDDYGGTFFSKIEWSAPESAGYYVTVENADLLSTGAYTLVVQRR